MLLNSPSIAGQPVMSAQQMQAFEQQLFQHIAPDVLMQTAGQAVFDTIRQHYPGLTCWQVFCGHGNNAGDGWVVAGLAQAAGINVSVVMVGSVDKYSTVVRAEYEAALALGVVVQPWSSWHPDPEVTLVVDALLGIGVLGAPRSPFDEAIEAINASPSVVVAIDLPSGLPTDSGWPEGPVVEADLTVTLIAYKRGAVTGRGKCYVGRLVLASLDTALEANLVQDYFRYYSPSPASLKAMLPDLACHTHKGAQGNVLVVGGDEGMAGAVILTAVAALRVGAGKVTVATREQHHASVVSYCPALMTLPPLVQSSSLDDYDVVVLGPGTRYNSYLHDLVQHYRHFYGRLVIDAGALSMLPQVQWLASEKTITPHPGEAAHLLSSSAVVVEQDRYQALSQLKQQTGAHVVLKGSGTLVGLQQQTGGYVCGLGNPGMATAGTGDVLAGMVGGLWAQGLPTATATLSAVLWHSLAADVATEQLGQRSMLATDLLAKLGPIQQ